MNHLEKTAASRRHDLDALRAFAMLLGIVLHAVLSLHGGGWAVRDTQPQEWLEWVMAGIHGFRMPLFIFVSGYFTMMLWRRRGLTAMVDQRYQRVFIPCMLGLVSVLPILHWTIVRVNQPATKNEPVKPAPKSLLIEAIRTGDSIAAAKLLADGVNPNEVDSESGIPPLGWAVMHGNAVLAERLLDCGANIEAKDRSGYRSLHSAMFVGKPAIVELLLKRGAEPGPKGPFNDSPRDSAKADWNTTKGICGALKIPLGTQEELLAGRAKCAELLAQHDGGEKVAKPAENDWRVRVRKSYVDFLRDDAFNIQFNFGAPPVHLFLTPQFDHLWFLWFLCWLVAIFAMCAWIVDRVPIPRLPRWLSMSPIRLLWLLPITMVPQVFMGIFSPGFGPDTSVGLIPQPHVFAYYGIFFFIGALTYDHDGPDSRLGRFWWLALPLALGLGLATRKLEFVVAEPLLAGAGQVFYAWAMSYGLLGMFRAVLNGESKVIRYLSDSAYWLYVAHLPLVIALQRWVRDWEWRAEAKLAFICVISAVALLVSYQLLVRHGWLGRLLNGPRIKSAPSTHPKERST